MALRLIVCPLDFLSVDSYSQDVTSSNDCGHCSVQGQKVVGRLLLQLLFVTYCSTLAQLLAAALHDGQAP
jgi:hypothetical protein